MSGTEHRLGVGDQAQFYIKEYSQERRIHEHYRVELQKEQKRLYGLVDNRAVDFRKNKKRQIISSVLTLKVTPHSVHLEFRDTRDKDTSKQAVSYVQNAQPQVDTARNASLQLRDISSIISTPTYPTDDELKTYFTSKEALMTPRTFFFISSLGYMSKLFNCPDTLPLTREYGTYYLPNQKIAAPSFNDYYKVTEIMRLLSNELTK